jgi:uncharacterized protein YbaP (TraB family)
MKFLSDSIVRKHRYYLYPLLLALIVWTEASAEINACRPYQLVEAEFDGPDKFGSGLLWEISREGVDSSYLFGTMHVDDEDILDLPEVVLTSLNNSQYFVMEIIPTQEDSMRFTTEMFFMDGNRLDQLVPTDIFKRTVDILSDYSMTVDLVTLMKPWAAYVIMSYPAGMGEVLDLKLLNLARQNGAEVLGLESFKEQIEIFSDMDLADQARILADVVCHYHRVDADLVIMKEYYLNQDLEALYRHSQRYSFADNSVYEQISTRLLSDRNNLMFDRLQSVLDQGNAFIAVGAMHLPGAEGLLNLLEMQSYRIKRIY